MSSRDESARSTSTSEKSPRSERNEGAMFQLSEICPNREPSCEEMVEEATDTSSFPLVVEAM